MSSLTEEKYLELIKDRENAWAIWDNSFGSEKTTEQFAYEEVIDDLKPNVIFLGLNPSKDLDENDLINFHDPKHHNDIKLKEAIQGSNRDNPICPNLYGGFMTDVVVDEVDANSANIDVKHIHTRKLTRKLDLLGQSSYHLICFGNKAYDAVQGWLFHEEKHPSGLLSGHLKKVNWNISVYRVVHFAALVKKATFKRQLEELDKVIQPKVSV